jgi:hypothetical protein
MRRKRELFLLVIVTLYALVYVFYGYAGHGEHIFALRAVMILFLAHYAHDSAIDYHHGAGAAGCHAAVQVSAAYAYAPPGGLTDGVLLRVHGAYAMLRYAAIFMYQLLELVARFIAVGQARGSSDVAGSQDLVVARYNAAGTPPVAGGALGYSVAYLHKILVPAGPPVVFLRHGATLRA